MSTSAAGLQRDQGNKGVIQDPSFYANARPPVDFVLVRAALLDIWQLLEDYAPAWYTEEHRDKLRSTLECEQR
jgi:hypothetical protein